MFFIAIHFNLSLMFAANPFSFGSPYRTPLTEQANSLARIYKTRLRATNTLAYKAAVQITAEKGFLLAML